MKECLAMLMVGGVEHTHMFSELNAWAIRNESRLWTAEKNNPETEQMLEPERQQIMGICALPKTRANHQDIELRQVS